MRGRKPRPTVQRVLDGNPGKRPINDAEPQPPPLATGPIGGALELPGEPVPDELDGHAAAVKEWRRLVPMLRGVSTGDRGHRGS